MLYFSSFSKICTLIFVLEMVVKMIALLPRGYVQSRWNLLDGFIVVMSIIDLVIVLCLPGSHHGAGFSVLRSLRLVCSLLHIKRKHVDYNI